MTLGDVAYLHDLTLENLTLWIVRPDITERLKALTDSIYLRVRLAAINHLATTVNALNTMIGAPTSTKNAARPRKPHQHRRPRATPPQEGNRTRKAVALLTKLAHLPSQRRKAATPSPLGEGRGGVAEISKQPTAPAAITPRPHAPTPCPHAPTPNPITPRDLHDRAGRLSPLPFRGGPGWGGVDCGGRWSAEGWSADRWGRVDRSEIAELAFPAGRAHGRDEPSCTGHCVLDVARDVVHPTPALP